MNRFLAQLLYRAVCVSIWYLRHIPDAWYIQIVVLDIINDIPFDQLSRLAQLVERETVNLKVVGSNPPVRVSPSFTHDT